MKRILRFVALLLFPTMVSAATLAEVSGGVDRAVRGGMSEAEEQSLLGSLGTISAEVADRYDAWTRSGSSESRGAATGLADALLPVLERLHRYHQDAIDRMQNAIIAVDGNPEVLYGQREWQVHRGFALASMGQLAWLYYRCAMLHPEKKEARNDWLRRAVEGFGDFIFAEDPRLRDESLLGRALAERELGEWDPAKNDLRAVIERGKGGPLYWAARVTLAEVAVAAGGPGALTETENLLREAGGGSLDTIQQARFLRFQALSEAARRGGGEGLRREARGLAAALAEGGPVWSKRVQEVAMGAHRDPREVLGDSAPAEWQAAENFASEDKLREAAPLYERVLKSPDRQHATLAHQRLGVCYFRLGRFADAEREFRTFLNAAPRSALASEASFLRFRAAEGVYRGRPTKETRELFRGAVQAFVQAYPKHESAHEAFYRWGELLQADRRWQEAADAYARVRGAPVFELRAAASEVQCLAEAMVAPAKDAKPEWFERTRRRAREAFSRFQKLAARAPKDESMPDLRARATLSSAMVEVSGPGGRPEPAVQALGGFEKTYPTAKDLHPLAGALRLSALNQLGRLEEAETNLPVWLASVDGARPEISEKLATAFLHTSIDSAPDDAAKSRRWAVLASRVFDRLKAEGRPLPAEAKPVLAPIYTEEGRLAEAAQLYRELLATTPSSKSLLRSAAMVADQLGAFAEAADYWTRLAKRQEVASPIWYDARLNGARALFRAGNKQRACAEIREVNAFRPDLRDAATRTKYDQLAAQTCGPAAC
ncbi:MAG: hypothetical protein QOD06_78 [Candidatus Binatota bacterium]|nr:hypothetical protein [Candidatus Binatota bacterium]